MSQTAFSEGLHKWARVEAEILAREFLRGRKGPKEPNEFLDGACLKNPLLKALRPTAEPAFFSAIEEAKANG